MRICCHYTTGKYLVWTWSLYGIQHCVSLEQGSDTFALQREKETEQLSLLLIKKKKKSPISGQTDICKYNHVFIHTPSCDQRKNPEATKMLSPNIWLLVSVCDWIITIPPRNISQTFNLFNLTNINCHSEYKISLLLCSKCKHQGEDKWSGEKYHLAEAQSSQASPNNGNNGEKGEYITGNNNCFPST